MFGKSGVGNLGSETWGRKPGAGKSGVGKPDPYGDLHGCRGGVIPPEYPARFVKPIRLARRLDQKGREIWGRKPGVGNLGSGNPGSGNPTPTGHNIRRGGVTPPDGPRPMAPTIMHDCRDEKYLLHRSSIYYTKAMKMFQM